MGSVVSTSIGRLGVMALDCPDGAEAAVVGFGAEKATEQPSPDQWRVMIDPAGHPFCLVLAR